MILKWTGDECPCDNVGIAHTDYTDTQIKTEVAKAEWISPEN